jgi:hypothetical protein
VEATAIEPLPSLFLSQKKVTRTKSRVNAKLRFKARHAFVLIDDLLQFNVVLFDNFAPKRSLIDHPLLHVFRR